MIIMILIMIIMIVVITIIPIMIMMILLLIIMILLLLLLLLLIHMIIVMINSNTSCKYHVRVFNIISTTYVSKQAQALSYCVFVSSSEQMNCRLLK